MAAWSEVVAEDCEDEVIEEVPEREADADAEREADERDTPD